ncbi:hypothetical protein FACS1894133_1080 [Clostridia bacterium]|nr:hypothetical protein FACS1894133_1080 [Clostridia bacterium]
MIKRKIMFLILCTVLASGIITSCIYMAVTKHIYMDGRTRELVQAAQELAAEVGANSAAGADVTAESHSYYKPVYGQGRDMEILGASVWIYLGGRIQLAETPNPLPSQAAPGRARGRSGISVQSASTQIEITQKQLDDIYNGNISTTAKATPPGNDTSAKNNRASLTLTVGVPIWQSTDTGADRTVIGAVFLSKPMSEVLETIYTLNIALILSSLFSFIVMQIPGYIAASRISTPIKRAADVAAAMSAGDYGVRAAETDSGEIGELCRAMNGFAAAAGLLEQTRRDYIANVSHELRTPVTAIRAMGETLIDGMADSPEKRELFYNNIVRESGRLSRLVNDLLELSRLQSGKTAIEITRFDVRAVVRNVYNVFAQVAEDCDVTLTLRGAAGTAVDVAAGTAVDAAAGTAADTTADVYAYGNADRVEQVLVVLTDNAIQHTPDGGRVFMEISDIAGTHCEISVTNTGSHIDEEHLPFIFDRFYKADKAHTNGGSGLGLSIAREIMLLLGGSINADNLTVDGSEAVRFVIKLNS